MLSRLLGRLLVGVVLFGVVSLGEAQDSTPARSMVVKTVDVSKQVELSGTLNPLATAQADRGAVDASMPMGRAVLLLNRPSEREKSLEEFLQRVQATGDAEFHHWLKPDEFGKRFGAAESDVAQVSAWLESQGLHVESVGRGRQVIVFSGTAGQFNQAFATRLDRFEIDGAIHVGNAIPLHVPEALRNVIARVPAIGDMENTYPQAQDAKLQARGAAETKVSFHARVDTSQPQWTQVGAATPMYAVTPADLAVQYDLGPLYAAGTNGAGTIIGVIGKSNINTAEVDTYRSLFGLAKGPVQVVVDGEDPAMFNDVTQQDVDLNDNPTVSYLGVEIAGGVAPGAQIRLYVAGGTPYEDRLLLAAQRAVDDDQADVLSVGFSECERQMSFSLTNYGPLWEQAAAQGQTVVVQSGYFGPAGCFSPYTNGVNGLGATPWNLSVGGTDFFYNDYATGGASASAMWNSTNDATTKGSLKASVAEQVWNDGLGMNAVPYTEYNPRAWASGGGPSTCGTAAEIMPGYSPSCLGGWPKPAWQSAVGVPQDGVRDTPDVALFAGDGRNLSAYAICEFAQDCTPDMSGNFSADFVGGSSAATATMAGVMSLVVQKYGRQGQAAAVLYALSKTTPGVFHDIARGGNNVPCGVISGEPNCVAVSGTNYAGGETAGYTAASGYDMASGLGSIDAAQLVNHWSDATMKSSATTLQLSSTSFQHGQRVNAVVNVTGSDGGTPTGDVALLTNSPVSTQTGQGFVTLQSGVGSGTFGILPGGTYQVTGRYGGNGVYGSSTSTPVSVTVTPEPSNINFVATLYGHYLGFGPFQPGTQLPYGWPLQFLVHPLGASSDGVATGSATFTLNSTTDNAAMDSNGYASWMPPALPVGSYTVSAKYAGDASFGASSSSSLPFAVVQGIPNVELNSSLTSSVVHQGDVATVGITVGSQQLEAAGTLAPTGIASVGLGDCNPYDMNLSYKTSEPLSTPAGTSSSVSSALLQLTNVAAGYYCIWAIYHGDANWEGVNELFVPGLTVVATNSVPTTTTLEVSPTTIVGGQTTSMSVTVSAPAGSTVAPTGLVTFYDNGAVGNGYYSSEILLTSGANGTSTGILTNQSAANFFNSGVNHMVAGYSGDATYAPSTSAIVDVTATQPGGDFTLASSATQIVLAGGKTGTVSVNLTSLLGFSGTVNLACAPSTTTAICSISPSSMNLTGSGNATMTFNAFTVASVRKHSEVEFAWTIFGAVMLLAWPRRRRRWAQIGLCTLALVFTAGISGCSSASIAATGGGGSTNPPTKAGSYTIAVTATSGSITHQVTVLVTVE